MGGLELGYGSDLDLVFLHAGVDGPTRGGPRPIDTAQFFNRLGQRVIHILTSHTRAGKVYEIDTRLRPSGISGILVRHVEAFGDYQLNEAWTWEHQALIKARAVSGEALITARFDAIRAQTLARRRDTTRLRADVIEMRERMRRERSRPEAGVFDLKQDPGGMVDIEFLVQYLVLRLAQRHPELVQWTDNVRLIQTLIGATVLNEVHGPRPQARLPDLPCGRPSVEPAGEARHRPRGKVRPPAAAHPPDLEGRLPGTLNPPRRPPILIQKCNL